MTDPVNAIASTLSNSRLTADGGTINVNGASVGFFNSTEYEIQNGGTLNITAIHGNAASSALSSSSIKFGHGGGTLVLQRGDGLNYITFKSLEGFGDPDAIIEVVGATAVSSVSKDLLGHTEVNFNNGLTVALPGDYYDAAKNLNIFQKSSGGNVYISSSPIHDTTTLPVTGDFDPVCYLADAMVETVSGEKPVQDLQVGDEVITRDAFGNISTQPIIWTGKSRLRANKALSDDRSGFPVRIKAGALAEKVPHRDLLVTSEHAIFLEGHFIPVRMLVNGRTISYDRSIEAYDYYHFETAQHSIVHVSGAATETFLDNGMRDQFAEQNQAENGAAADGVKQWGLDSAAPLCVTPEFVRDIYESLKDRAAQIDPSDASALTAGYDVTEDPDLNVETVDGARLELREVTNGWYLYSLPAGLSQLYLTSRVTRPCDALGPFIDDRRLLGVLVGEIVIEKPSGHVEVTDHLTNERLEGWSSIENHLSRWTSGRAEIILDDVTDAHDNVLAIKILSTGLHRLPPRPEDVMPKSVLGGVMKADSVLQPAF
ncbi:Hint domain-containing protein [Candidatus Kirkpatrickella diaphorinae]|uniref:Hint domain-containing protein n=1 Tax=Candidatus Kirkpatrickella diaphorinae TaxID=2984322 RepID=A0ABY6GJT3_9PROT|nr:Hint domain-containing protein [Candidatus Kirkpatrickella diaphorinae]UYH51070.1 Hint domain-containing protein [Candidatus Kirkpatrickella diaphorinae]